MKNAHWTPVWVPAPIRTGGGAARTDAGSDGRTALLVAFGTAVAGDASHAVLAGALACGLVAGLAGSTHRVAITGCEEHKTEGSERLLVPFPTQGCPMDPAPEKENERQWAGLSKLTHAL